MTEALGEIVCRYCGNKRFSNEPMHKCKYGQVLDWLENEVGRVK